MFLSDGLLGRGLADVFCYEQVLFYRDGRIQGGQIGLRHCLDFRPRNALDREVQWVQVWRIWQPNPPRYTEFCQEMLGGPGSVGPR
jgi:hypothetical protein